MLLIKRYRYKQLVLLRISVAVLALTPQLLPRASGKEIVVRSWNERNLAAIRNDAPHPPVHARNIYHLSVAMYDAWAAYDPLASGYVYHQKHDAADVASARREAISYAAYRILKERYSISRSPALILPELDAQMAALGYPKDNVSIDTTTPAGVGNTVAAAVSARFINDGARQNVRYIDSPAALGGYVPVNEPLVSTSSGTSLLDVNRWQRLIVANALDQSGVPIPPLQTFVGAQWLNVMPFGLVRDLPGVPWIDRGAQPRLNGIGDAALRDQIVEIIRFSSELTPDDGVLIDISPGEIGNNPLGTNDGVGYEINPVTGSAYEPNLVKRGDFARVLAEFWADGPNSETPPGHWNAIANSVSDTPGLVKRIGGVGPVVDDLEWDVKMYLALNAAVHDAACAAWSLKRYYDGPRPISIIRYMGARGQSSDPAGPSYHPDGLPLVPDLIEVVTAETAKAGARHEGLTVGAVAIRSWPGQPGSPATQHSGVRWIESINWLPYQRETFVTPAFPGYVSGHSTFSRAAAEVLTAITGSAYFPGGMGTFTAPAETFLAFERGPTAPVQLQWATYYDAADQAGLSRLWGGIHVSEDDLTGRQVGAICGRGAWSLARRYFGPSPLLQKGAQIPDAAPGTVYGPFSTPQVGAVAVPWVLKNKKRKMAVVAPAGGALLVAGQPLPGFPGRVIQRITALSGDAAIVILAAGKEVPQRNRAVLLTGLSRQKPEVAVQAGVTATHVPDVTIGTFGALDGTGADIFFLASLRGPGVSSKNNLALCTILQDKSIRILAREGDVIDGKKVSVLGTLAGSKGTLAEGRWRINDHHFAIRLGFTDKSQSLYSIPSNAASPADWLHLAETGISQTAALANAEIRSFGLPAIGPDHWASIANLTPGVAGVTKARSKALVAKRTTGSLQLVAFTGGAVPDSAGVPIPGAVFKGIGDPVAGVKGRTAFLGKLAGSQITSGNSEGIWYTSDGGQPKLLARAGDAAPGGGRWASFTSLVLPDHVHCGPVFVATLRPDPVQGIPKGAAGIWRVDGAGEMHLMLRTGQELWQGGVAKQVTQIRTLVPSAGSIGAACGYDNSGRLSVAAAFTDGTQMLLQF